MLRSHAKLELKCLEPKWLRSVNDIIQGYKHITPRRFFRTSSSKKTKTDGDKESRSKESTRNKPDAKKKVKQTRQYDEDISSPLEPKKKKKNDLSKLSRKDRLYHSNSNDRTLESMATSIASPYHSSKNTLANFLRLNFRCSIS